MTRALLALADGTVFEGLALGYEGETVGEVVFNTLIQRADHHDDLSPYRELWCHSGGW